jgi:F-type H+-transporting ATPase subunit delta
LSENKISITSNNSYAQALFELANEDKSLAKVEEQVVAIIRLINEIEEFRYLIKNPTTSIEDLTRVIETISEKNNFDNLLKRFLVFFNTKKKIFLFRKNFK